MGPADQAKSDVIDVQRALTHDDGAQKASEIFISQVGNEYTRLATADGINSDQFKADWSAYLNEIKTSLKAELPTISVGWVADHKADPLFLSPATMMNPEGSINLDMIKSTAATSTDQGMKILADTFLQNTDKVDGSGVENYTDSVITADEVTSYLGNRKLQTDNLIYAKMFSTKGGRALANTLDTYGDLFAGVTDDDTFGSGNINQMLSDYKNHLKYPDDSNGYWQGAYNAIHQAAVDAHMTDQDVADALERMTSDKNPDQMRLMQSDNGCFSVDSIAKGAGYTDAADCLNQNACTITDSQVNVNVASDAINQKSATTKVTTDGTTLVLNGDTVNPLPVEIDYKDAAKGFATVTWDPTTRKVAAIHTGDNRSLSFNPNSNHWEETFNNQNMPITEPTLNPITGEINYSYAPPLSGSVKYDTLGNRITSDVTVAPQTTTDATTTTNSAGIPALKGGDWTAGSPSFGEEAHILALRDNISDKRARANLLLLGFDQNFPIPKDADTKGYSGTRRDAVIQALNAYGADDSSAGVPEKIKYTYNNGTSQVTEYISIYSILKGKINV